MRSINSNAPVKCSKSILIHTEPQKVWSVLTNINQWSAWQTDISSPQQHGDLREGTTFDWKTGGVWIHSTLHTVEPYQFFGWTGKTLGVFAVHNWILSEKNGSTFVEVQESMEGFLTHLFRRNFQKNLENGMQKWLDLLKKASESEVKTLT
jgi:uncharacterized protein YndB with AHSA1/START domain